MPRKILRVLLDVRTKIKKKGQKFYGNLSQSKENINVVLFNFFKIIYHQHVCLKFQQIIFKSQKARVQPTLDFSTR